MNAARILGLTATAALAIVGPELLADLGKPASEVRAAAFY